MQVICQIPAAWILFLSVSQLALMIIISGTESDRKAKMSELSQKQEVRGNPSSILLFWGQLSLSPHF